MTQSTSHHQTTGQGVGRAWFELMHSWQALAHTEAACGLSCCLGHHWHIEDAVFASTQLLACDICPTATLVIHSVLSIW
jgi:hypothetical protein